MLLCYTERRHMFNLPRAIAHAVLDKGKKTIGSECRERSDCVEVKGSQILKELHELKRMLTCAKFFSCCKRSLAFLFAAGFEEEDILYRKRTARILKPAFTVIRDKESKSLLVFIRGTRSIKDTLTDALCAPVSFDHFICSDHERHNVSGHAHRAACMSLELAEFGKSFITSIINGYDIVPTLSASSVHDFISEDMQ
ncbi:hypothetical protein VNO80_09025 [Phaseolus coccineus]|uniref:Uncharacterized protein n=1 Tax=Phaseolus coccineus TaxID=3886 RepID=A0AAN9N5F2_PHACN